MRFIINAWNSVTSQPFIFFRKTKRYRAGQGHGFHIVVIEDSS